MADFVREDMLFVDDRNRFLREYRLPDYDFDVSFGR